jgi:glycosyltransferase involved in cell wall biosynthesis
MKKWEEFIDIYHLYSISPLPGGGLYKMLGGKRNVVGTLNSLSAICPICVKTCRDDRCAFRNRLVCLHVHDGNGLISSILYSVVYPVLTALSRNLDCYIALTNSVKQSHILNDFNCNRITVIPNFFERPRDSVIPASYNERASKSAIFNILYVGAVICEKGLGVLIKAFLKVSDKHSEAHLTIIGSGKGFDDYVRMVEDLSLSNKVTFKGYVNEKKLLKQIYLGASVFVHPAICLDPFPRALLEAMTFEIPTIVSNMGSLPEIVGSGGLVFESGNVDNLTEKIEILIQNPEVRKRLSSNCKEIVKRFNPDCIPCKIVELYKTLIDPVVPDRYRYG